MKTRAIPERLRGVFTRRYTNLRLPLPFPYTIEIAAYRYILETFCLPLMLPIIMLTLCTCP